MILLTEGRFGAAVADAVHRTAGATVESLLAGKGGYRRMIEGSGAVAVATWRLYEAECDELDQACFDAGVPWIGVYPSGSHLYCGPLVAPGHGACFACYRRRYLTHLPSPDREVFLRGAYRENPALGVEGFVPAAVSIAAALIVSGLANPARDAGRVVRIDLLGEELVDTRVVPVHGCLRCEREGAVGPDRFVKELVPELRSLCHGN